ncbi:hypothetical protein llap_2562 [Limosa lapponica baueri]|uniref:Uncharacterized protein n=1 Tax=Limosa lapponica baueri TaxID=1758121 RepID=A0A2I0UM48_LIMLA|nr:hypothetical protein llap_2562 [Limosa lapponica baueri]
MSKGTRGLSVEDKEGWFPDALTLKLRLEIPENLTRILATGDDANHADFVFLCFEGILAKCRIAEAQLLLSL